MNRNEVNQTEQTAITNSMDSRAAALDTEPTDKTIADVRKVKFHAGSISPEGVVNMFNFDGMDLIQAFKELLDNSTDWRRPHNKLNINFIVNNDDELIYCDNGQGMTGKQLVRAFCLFNENQDAGGNPTGKCGYGLKSALRKLSNCGKHTIITSDDGVVYLTQKSDWSGVKVMDGAFPIYDSDQSEIEEHKKYIKDGSGTLIKVKLTSDITDLLNNQFTDDMKIGKIKDRFSFAYGKIPDIDISYKYKSQQEQKIKFYNPFGLSNDNYLFGTDGCKTTELTISIYPSGNEVISWHDPKRDEYGYFHKKTRNMDKSPTFCENETDLPPPNKLKSTKPKIIKVEFTTACLKPSDDYFDMNNPKIPENTGLSCNSDYKKEFFGDNISDDLNGTMSVNRNGSNIGLVNLTKRAQTGGAGSAKPKFKRVHMEKELAFQATPNHNDITDIFMGVNKTKHNYKLPVNAEMVRRVCEYLAEEHGDYLWEMIEQSVAENEQAEETNASEYDESDEQTFALQQTTADPLPLEAGEWQGTDTQDAADDSEGDTEVKPVVKISRPVTKTKVSTQIKCDTDSESDSDFEDEPEGVGESKGGETDDQETNTNPEDNPEDNTDDDAIVWEKQVYYTSLSESQQSKYASLTSEQQNTARVAANKIAKILSEIQDTDVIECIKR